MLDLIEFVGVQTAAEIEAEVKEQLLAEYADMMIEQEVSK